MKRTDYELYRSRHMPRTDYVLFGAKSTAKRGTALPHAKLNKAKVRYLRSNPKGLTLRQLAAELNVHYRTVERAHYRETWGHV